MLYQVSCALPCIFNKRDRQPQIKGHFCCPWRNNFLWQECQRCVRVLEALYVSQFLRPCSFPEANSRCHDATGDVVHILHPRPRQGIYTLVFADCHWLLIFLARFVLQSLRHFSSHEVFPGTKACGTVCEMSKRENESLTVVRMLIHSFGAPPRHHQVDVI